MCLHECASYEKTIKVLDLRVTTNTINKSKEINHKVKGYIGERYWISEGAKSFWSDSFVHSVSHHRQRP